MRLLALSTLLLATSAFAQDPIRPGSDSFDGSTISSSETSYKVMLLQPMQQEIGTYDTRLVVDQASGTITSTSVLNVPMANQSQRDSVVAAWPSLAPIAHSSESPQGFTAITFDGLTIGGMKMPNGADMEMIDVTLDEPVFDGAWVQLIATALPLAEGYTADVASYTIERGALDMVALTVTGKEMVAGPDGEASTWTVSAKSGPMTMTYSIDESNRDLVRIRFSPQPGVEIEMVRQ